jgi:hypothetical protein
MLKISKNKKINKTMDAFLLACSLYAIGAGINKINTSFGKVPFFIPSDRIRISFFKWLFLSWRNFFGDWVPVKAGKDINVLSIGDILILLSLIFMVLILIKIIQLTVAEHIEKK